MESREGTESDGVAIREAEAADAPALSAFAGRLFAEVFGPDNRPEDMAVHVAKTFTAERQRAEVLDPGMTTLLLHVDGVLAGYTQLRAGPAPACVAGPEPVEVQRFYVDHPWHGRGLAQRLMDAAARAAQALGARTLWLGVWERNPRAIAFYAKSGFVDVGSQLFWLGSDRQIDRVMARPLGER